MKVAVHEDPEVIALMGALLPQQLPTLSSWGMPDTGLLILMSPCDGRCFFCAQREVTDMPAEMITPWGRIERWMSSARGQGVRRLLLGGTEPASHPRFDDSLRLAAEVGFTEVQLMTSGVRLAKEGIAPHWHELGIRSVCVPLYAADANTHDDIVGVPDHHATVLRGLDHARAAGISVEVHTLGLRRTLEHLTPLSQLTQSRWQARLVVAPLREKDSLFKYADEAPMYGSVASAVRDLDLTLAGFPRCAAPEMARWAPEVISLYFRGQRTVHLDSCSSCSLRPGCPGAVSAQLTAFGSSELTPVHESAEPIGERAR